MKIIVAMDSFKGSLSALQACQAVRRGLLRVATDAEVQVCPMADGGEGTAQALVAARSGEWIPVQVMGPLPDRQVEAGYAWFPDRQEALVEMATASGLPLLEPHEYNPLKTTTFGTGQLVAEASGRNPTRLLLAVGGSATVDGGVGAASALGWRFLDSAGNTIGLGGGGLDRLASIQPPAKTGPPVEVLCDVNNPLLGEKGAARIYGPQKGATPEMVERLEANLRHLAQIVNDQLGIDMNVPGAGAAGGLAGGALAFMNARLVAGIETVMTASGLPAHIASADWIITGEGRFDEQSLHGKVVSGVTALAAQHDVPVAVLAGTVRISPETCREQGIQSAIASRKENVSLQDALDNADSYLEEAAREFAQLHLK